jgi:hypothetical protein
MGRPVLIVRALNGLRSSGTRWRDHIASTLRDDCFMNCLADPDMYMRPAVKPTGIKFWEYVLVCVNDILVVSYKPPEVMDMQSRTYKLKAGSIGQPTNYLGATIKEYQQPDSGNDTLLTDCWSFSPDVYVNWAVAEVERTLDDIDQKLKTNVTTPLSAGYRPELDAT